MTNRQIENEARAAGRAALADSLRPHNAGVHRTDPCETWEQRAAQLWQLLEDVKDQMEMYPEASGVSFRAAVTRILEQRGPAGLRGFVPAVSRAG